MSKIKDYLMDKEQEEWDFAEKEHAGGQHKTFTEGCPSCFSENRMIQAHKTVNSHDEMLEKHPALRNPWGDNYPTGFNPTRDL